MSFNWLLIWTVAISCVFIFLTLARNRVRRLIYYVPVGFVSLVLIVGYRINPASAGYYAGGVWFSIVLLPGIAAQTSSKYLNLKRYRTAYWMSLIAAYLHPWGGMRDQPLLVTALRLLHCGQSEKAIRIFEVLRIRNSPPGRAAFVILIKLQGSWLEMLNVIANSTAPQKLLADPLMMNAYLQALGETGQTELLIQEYARLGHKKQRLGSALSLNTLRLIVAVFSGRLDLVAKLFDGPLGHFDTVQQKMWLATAMQASGKLQQAEPLLSELENVDDRLVAVTAQRRLQRPVGVLPALTGVESEAANPNQILIEMENAIDHEQQFALMNSVKSMTPVATYVVLAMLLVMFVAEMFHGRIGTIVMESDSLSVLEKSKLLLQNTANGQNLVDMGALVLPVELTEKPIEGIVKSAFMHLGILHLLMNMAGIWIFAPRIEESWGSFLTLTAYLTCAICSVYLMTVIPLGIVPGESVMLVGASGGVMGLIGCLLGYLGWGQMVRRNPLVGSEFNLLFIIVMIQVVFDQSTPAVSSECHLLGLIIGTLIGFLVGFYRTVTMKTQNVAAVA